MKLSFETTTSSLIVSQGYTAPISQLIAQRGDAEYLLLELLQDGQRIEMPGAAFTFAVKVRYNDADPVVIADTWAWNATLKMYEAAVNYVVTALDTLLLIGEPQQNDRIHLKAQFAMLRPSLGGWRKSQVVDFVLHNDVWRGAGDPVPPVPGVIRPQMKVINTPVVNAHATPNTLLPVTGLTVPVSAGKAYSFRFQIPYTTAASSVGSNWVVTVTGTATLNYIARCSTGDTSERVNFLSTISAPSPTANSAANGNMAILEGVVIPSADGTLGVSFSSELSGSAVTALGGSNVTYAELY